MKRPLLFLLTLGCFTFVLLNAQVVFAHREDYLDETLVYVTLE